jgi:hypothetical protein
MIRQWLIVAKLASALLLAGACDNPKPLKDCSKPECVVNNALVDQSEREIREVYGKPVIAKDGYHSLGSRRPCSLPNNPIRTLIFKPKDGNLWVWLEKRGEEWICFESCWFADGVRF